MTPRLLPSLLLLAALILPLSGEGGVAPLDWLEIHKSQYRLLMNGAENTFTVDRRTYGNMVEASYWHRVLGFVTISWPMEKRDD